MFPDSLTNHVCLMLSVSVSVTPTAALTPDITPAVGTVASPSYVWIIPVVIIVVILAAIIFFVSPTAYIYTCIFYTNYGIDSGTYGPPSCPDCVNLHVQGKNFRKNT